MKFSIEMGPTLAQMYDLAKERPETACSRMRYASHPHVFFAWAKQIESVYGLFSEELWNDINKCETIPTQERHVHQETVAKIVFTFITTQPQESNHENNN